MPLSQFTHWFNLLSSRIARCRSVVRTGSIFWVVNHCISDYSSKIGYTTVSSSLYNVTSVHLNIWSCSLGLAVHLAHSIFLVIIHKPDKQVSTLSFMQSCGCPHLHTVLLRKTGKACRYYISNTIKIRLTLCH